MIGPTLIDIREHIEALAVKGGQSYVVCGRTGDRPVPAAGNRFQDRATARGAARATEQYRSALRRYDPQVPYTEQPLQSVQVTAVDGGWQPTFILADAGDQNGLVSAPIDGEVRDGCRHLHRPSANARSRRAGGNR